MGGTVSASEKNSEKMADEKKTDSQKSPGSEGKLKASDLFNPYKYYLKHVHPLGMRTECEEIGVVTVSMLLKGGIAEQFGVQLGMYLLCVNGRTCTGQETEADFQNNPDGVRMTLAKKRRHEFNQTNPQPYLGRYSPQNGFEYVLSRLNLITFKLSSLNVVDGQGGRVCIGEASNRQDLEKVGLRIGDSIVAVDYAPIKDKQHCESVLQRAQNDIIHLTVERSKSTSTSATNLKVPEITPYSLSSSDDYDLGSQSAQAHPGIGPSTPLGNSLDRPFGFGFDEEHEGDPSSGVPPTIPADVQRIVAKGSMQLARKILCAKSCNQPTTKTPAPCVPHVKIDKKNIKKANLFKQDTSKK